MALKQQSPSLKKCFILISAIGASMPILTVLWLFNTNKTGKLSEILLKTPSLPVAAETLKMTEFIQCRKQFLRQIHEANLAFSDEQEPMPITVYIKENSPTKRFLHVITLAGYRRKPGQLKEERNQSVLHKGCYDVQRLDGKWLNWLKEGQMTVATGTNGSQSNCSFTENTLFKAVVSYECPLGNISQKTFSLSMVRPLSVFRFGHEGFSSCNIPLTKPRFRLVSCSVVADIHMDRLPEWIEYHRLIGFEHFFIYYNSKNFDDLFKLLQIYVQQMKIVTLIPFHNEDIAQLRLSRFTEPAAYQDCVNHLKGSADWIAIHDADELFRALLSSQSLLPDYLDALYQRQPSSMPGFSFRAWNYFFPSSVNSKPCKSDGFYSRITTMNFREKSPTESFFKAIIRPRNVIYTDVHEAFGLDGKTTKENIIPITDGYVIHVRPSPRFSLRTSPLEEDKTFPSEFANVLFEQLKLHGFPDYRREKICENGTEIKGDIYSGLCSIGGIMAGLN